MPQPDFVPAISTPSYSLLLTQNVLRRIYSDFKQGCGPASATISKSSQRFHDDDELMEFPDMPDRIDDEDFDGRTAADILNDAEIAELNTAGTDPYTKDRDGRNRGPQPKMPLLNMFFAARFAALISSPDKAASLGTAQSVSFLCMPTSGEREPFCDRFPDILEHTALALSTDGAGLQGVAIVPFFADSPTVRIKNEFTAKIDRLIAEGRHMIVISPSPNDLSVSARALCGTPDYLPQITGDMVIEILRFTHSVTEQLSEVFVRGCLPADADLQQMPLPLLQAAFAEPTTIKVAQRMELLSQSFCSQARSDVATIDSMYLPTSAADDMKQMLDDLALWRRGELDWSDVTSSVLLFGPPGTGKTLLAQSLAGSADVPLVATSYGDCQRAGHQGDFLRVLSEKVEQAVASAPCIFFLDELDSFSNRKQSNHRSGYVAAIVNTLLEHLSRLNNTDGIVVVGATNYPENVDAAVLRPGRFDLHIALNAPDKAGIKRLLEIELGDETPNFDLAPMLDRLLGQSGAQIAAVVRDARGKARRARTELCDKHLIAALDRVVAAADPVDLYRIAVHEAGHAVVAHALGLPLPEIVRVTPQGGEYVGRKPFAATKRAIDDQIVVTLAGRAAEACIIGSVSDGAASDLVQATELAFRARYHWGLYANNLLSLSTQKMLDLDPLSPLGSIVNADLKSRYTRAKDVAETHASTIRRVADALLEHREMDGASLSKLLFTPEMHSPDQQSISKVE